MCNWKDLKEDTGSKYLTLFIALQTFPLLYKNLQLLLWTYYGFISDLIFHDDTSCTKLLHLFFHELADKDHHLLWIWVFHRGQWLA